jgi:predicted nucleic acid-binding protein
MMKRDTIYFIDANVPMYAHGRHHPYRRPCQRVLTLLARGEISGVTDSAVHQEIIYRYLSLERAHEAQQVSSDFLTLVPGILPFTRREVEKMIDLTAIHAALPTRDLVHLAIMINHDLTHIISVDTHFDQVEEIKRVDPLTSTI